MHKRFIRLMSFSNRKFDSQRESECIVVSTRVPPQGVRDAERVPSHILYSPVCVFTRSSTPAPVYSFHSLVLLPIVIRSSPHQLVREGSTEGAWTAGSLRAARPVKLTALVSPLLPLPPPPPPPHTHPLFRYTLVPFSTRITSLRTRACGPLLPYHISSWPSF
jgi:hypothetical protein